MWFFKFYFGWKWNQVWTEFFAKKTCLHLKTTFFVRTKQVYFITLLFFNIKSFWEWKKWSISYHILTSLETQNKRVINPWMCEIVWQWYELPTFGKCCYGVVFFFKMCEFHITEYHDYLLVYKVLVHV